MTNSKKRVLASAPNVPPPAADILRNLYRETVELNGEEISMLEAGIRLLYSRSLKGDTNASVDLQRIRDRCGAESVPRPAGFLVIPEKVSQEEWERKAFENHRQP